MGMMFPAETADLNSSEVNITLSDDNHQVIHMDVTAYGWEPNSFVLKKGVPVRWEIDAKQLNGCNNEIIVREYGLDIVLKKGLQVVEFTPEEEGTIRWSCWMGMIPGQFIVTDDVEVTASGEVNQEDIPELPEGSSCGGSCGDPSCGAAAGGSCGCGR
jgi:plastocyanin domain-containing protein